MLQRPRRNRLTPTLRNLVQENYLQVSSLIQPLFLVPGENIKLEIKSLPGIFRFSEDLLLEEIGACMAVGVETFLIFTAIPEELKDKEICLASVNEYGNSLKYVPKKVKDCKKDIR